MKAKEVREMTAEELTNKLSELKQELFNLRFSHQTGQLSDTSRLQKCKKDIARVLTTIKQRELAAK